MANCGKDALGVLRGARAVARAATRLQKDRLTTYWLNSDLRSSVAAAAQAAASQATTEAPKISANLQWRVKEALERASMVGKGVQAFTVYSTESVAERVPRSLTDEELRELSELNILNAPDEGILEVENVSSGSETAVKPRGVPPIEKEKPARQERTETSKDEKKETPKEEKKETLKDDKKATLKYEKKVKLKDDKKDLTQTTSPDLLVMGDKSSQPKLRPSTGKHKKTLDETAKQRKVPSSRIARVMSFGGLAAGLGVGTMAEMARRSLGLKEGEEGKSLDSLFLTPANAQRIVDTLCKVRGAALKIGQILSIQDNSVISPQLQAAFERVRQAADYMPIWQVEQVLASELGPHWRSTLSSFESYPFAAASIGQVHQAKLLDGRDVAMKIQYPGVAKGIESDIDNLVSVLKIWNIFPQGMFIDNLVEVAKRELAWEVDYDRERVCTKQFRDLLQPYPEYYVPEVIDHLCTKQVFTTELIEGVPVDKCIDMDESVREFICRSIMYLCLRELFVFRYMQTDPNWSNFFYNQETKQIILLDFGASRTYDKAFMDKYIEVIKAAAEGDRETVLLISREMGFLTGYESKIMEEAHVNAVMILGEVFSKKGAFDFGGQDTTQRIQQLVPTIVTHRLCPPPEEIYSLHRKLSGVFLLCAKLKVKIECYSMFDNVYKSYKFG